MTEAKSSRLHLRSFISLLTALSFLTMTVSGIILFITPQGRIAYWLDWRFMGLSKSQWEDMHIITSLLFALAGLWHVYLNWRALLNYLKDKVKKTLALKAELVAAAVITLFCTLGGIYGIPPLHYILLFNDSIKESWVKTPEDEPIINHAELLSLKSFVQKIGIELEPALRQLQNQGIKVVGPEEKLLDIARKNSTSPAAIAKLLKPLEQKLPASTSISPATQEEQHKIAPSSALAGNTPPSSGGPKWTPELVEKNFEGKGVGRKTLADICSEYGLDQKHIIKKLAAKNISMAPGDTLKKVAEDRSEVPIELLKIILVGEDMH